MLGVISEQPRALTSQQKGPAFDLLSSADRLVFRFPKTRKTCCCFDENNTEPAPLFHIFTIGTTRQQLARRNSSHASYAVVQEFRFPDCLCDVDMWASLCCCCEDCFAVILSCCLPPGRKPFLYDVIDQDTKTSIIRIDKPYRCLWPYQGPICCYGCASCRICQDEINLESPSGNFIGRVAQNNCCQEFPYLSVYDYTGRRQVLSIGQPTSSSTCCTASPTEPQQQICRPCLCLCGPYRLALATCLTGCCMSSDEIIELELYNVYRTDENGRLLTDHEIISSNKLLSPAPAGSMSRNNNNYYSQPMIVGSISKIIKPRPNCAMPSIEFEIRLSPELDINMRAGVIGSFLLLFNTTQPTIRISRE